MKPSEVGLLPQFRCGSTNLVARTTARADELSAEELRAGRRRLERKVRRYGPQWVAFVGLGAYRIAFATPAAAIGPQAHAIAGARVWVLPNTSGLNANYQAADFEEQFRALRRAVRQGHSATSLRPSLWPRATRSSARLPTRSAGRGWRSNSGS